MSVQPPSLDSLFHPQSVAVFGASATPGSVGNILMRNLLENAFGGVIFPINPKHRAVQCVHCYPNCAKGETTMFDRVILRGTEGGLKGQMLVLENEMKYILGRSRNCSLLLPDPHLLISRYHCQIKISAPYVHIQDLGSLNGTYVNRERIEETDLTGGDEVQVGKFWLVFLLGPRSQAELGGGGAQVGG